MKNCWTKEQAWEWYKRKEWIVGCNFVPSDCINSIEIWQESGFERVMETVSIELKLAQSIGMNSVRMISPFYVWKYQRDGFIERIDNFLNIASVHGITLMPVLFDDCCVPKELWREPSFGTQPEPEPGHHGGMIIAPFSGSKEVGYNLCDDKENWPLIEEYVHDLLSSFGKDNRILAWDIWNEPGNNNRGSMSLEFMVRAFEIARAENPIQPLTAGPWEFGDDYLKPYQGLSGVSEIEKKAIEISDIISFHYYGSLEYTKKLIEELKVYKRPLLVTEWLHRPFNNNIITHMPLFKKNGIGCYNWGLVNGKTQTNEPWDIIRGIEGLDLSLWQHDLFKKDMTPYNEEEINYFKELTIK